MTSFETPPKTLPELIKQAREANSLTQTAFGRLFNPPVAQPTVARWEKGEQLPDRKHFPRIASLLNITLDELFEFIEAPLDQTSSLTFVPSVNTYIPNKRHLTILNRGAVNWNQWRDKNPELLPELAGAQPLKKDLDGIDLSVADLRGVDFNELSLENAILFEADFRGAKLTKANLRNVDLRQADLRGANLTSADLRSADLRGAELGGAILTEADLSNANLEGADLYKATLQNTHLVSANLKKANFSEAVFRDARLCEANLKNANFSNSDLTFVDLRGAILNGANFENVILKSCLVYGVSAWNVNLKGAVQKDLNICSDNKHCIYVKDIRSAYLKSLALENPENVEIQNHVNQLQQILEKKVFSDNLNSLNSSKSQLVKRERGTMLSQDSLLLMEDEVKTLINFTRVSPLKTFFMDLMDLIPLFEIGEEAILNLSSFKTFFTHLVPPFFRRLVSNELIDENELKTSNRTLKKEKTEREHNYRKSEPQLSLSDYQHPARIEYIYKNGPIVVLGLQDHDFLKLAFERCTGHRESSIEHLHGIGIYVYSSAESLKFEDGSPNNDALIRTGKSFKWYSDPDEAFDDFRNRVEGFGGNVNQTVVYSEYVDLKARIENALCSPQVDFRAAINNFIPAPPPDDLFPELWWLEGSKKQISEA